MRAVFVHDHQFVIDGRHVYSDKIPYVIWQRYLAHFSLVRVVARHGYEEINHAGLPQSSGPGVDFRLVESISNLKSLATGSGEAATLIEAEIRKADILIARLPSELGLLACKIARRLDKPYVVEVVGCAWDGLWNYGTTKARAYAPLLFHRMRRAVSHAPYVSYVSQAFLQTRYPAPRARRTVAVSNVELPPVTEAVLKKRFDRQGTGTTTFVIGLIGSLKARYKGVDLAIEAIAGLRAAKTDAHLRVLGGGDSTSFAQLARGMNVQEYVHFDGILSNREAVMAWLDDVDIYIQPSRQEGVPRALIEAMSRGCPAIGSTCGGIPELLQADCLFPIGDAKQLQDRLRNATESENWRLFQARQNVERAKLYAKEVLDARRRSFFEEIMRDLKSQERSMAATR